MSINHYSAELPESHHYYHGGLFMDPSSSPPKPDFSCLTPRQLYAGPMTTTTTFSFNLNTSNDDDDDLIDERDAAESAVAPKELLFEKPLTPSDVGKLNRLVIPKQHAEKCFPLNGGESGENGLLLSFEDEVGKLWRFRYSYWNSSQSYVLTKGWSRFVKEKRLDAGDVVVFSRHRADACRLFIGWRRRNSIPAQDHTSLTHPPAAAANGACWNRIPYSNSGNPHHSQHQLQLSPLPYGGSDHCPHAGPIVLNQTATTSGSGGNFKRLRLFGVNLECQAAAAESEPSTPVGLPIYTHHHQYLSGHMDATFSGGDAYQQG